MKKLLLTSASFFILTFIFAQTYCGTSRYDTEMFPNVTTTSDVVYGQNLDLNNNMKVLKMDIYQPTGDVAVQRPLIILAHGGSFIGGSKTSADQVTLCTRFAKRGYVVATIDYRIGMGFPINQASAQKAVWRATQDMKAAVRFFRKDAATTNTYKIDPAYVFIGGYSAGAFMAVQYAYLDQPSEIPSAIDTNQLGGLEGSSGNPGYPTNINAVLNFAGAVGDTSWINPGDEPMVTAQGDNDGTVPYCTDLIYVSGFQIMTVSGGGTMHIRCYNVGINNPIHTFFGQDHCASVGSSSCNPVNMDTTVVIASDFVYRQMGCTPLNTAVYTNNQTCTSTATGFGDAAILKEADVSIYPNPSNGQFTVQSSGFKVQRIEIYNLLGEKVAAAVGSGSHSTTMDDESLTINLSSQPGGMYFVKLVSDENIITASKMIVVSK